MLHWLAISVHPYSYPQQCNDILGLKARSLWQMGKICNENDRSIERQGAKMSYCRFSCDNFKSDVYVYESSEGFVVNVAEKKLDAILSPLPNFLSVTPEEYLHALNVQSSEIEKSSWVKIGMKYDGDQKVYDTLQETHKFLLELRDCGYHIPQHAIDMLRSEAK